MAKLDPSEVNYRRAPGSGVHWLSTCGNCVMLVSPVVRTPGLSATCTLVDVQIDSPDDYTCDRQTPL